MCPVINRGVLVAVSPRMREVMLLPVMPHPNHFRRTCGCLHNPSWPFLFCLDLGHPHPCTAHSFAPAVKMFSSCQKIICCFGTQSYIAVVTYAYSFKLFTLNLTELAPSQNVSLIFCMYHFQLPLRVCWFGSPEFHEPPISVNRKAPDRSF